MDTIFICSTYIKEHPMLLESANIKIKYLGVFSYYIRSYISNNSAKEIINLYQDYFNVEDIYIEDKNLLKQIIIELFTWKYQKKDSTYFRIIFIQDVINYLIYFDNDVDLFLQDLKPFFDDIIWNDMNAFSSVTLKINDLNTSNECKQYWLDIIENLSKNHLKQTVIQIIKLVILTILIWWPFIGLIVVLIYSFMKHERFLHSCKKVIVNIFITIRSFFYEISEYFCLKTIKNKNIYIIPYYTQINRMFIKNKSVKVLVTANISSGKSTLINALVGKSLVRTSQESCTGNLCYVYNKPKEDNQIFLMTDSMFLNAREEKLNNLDRNVPIKISSYFHLLNKVDKRICIIDTPGVNSAINKNHGIITKQVIKENDYDKLIYVLNGNKLGTEEELNYLKWIIDNVDNNKIIFVLNKLDDFRKKEDDISQSIKKVNDDLKSLGFEKPKVFPLSAYFGLLVKKKKYQDDLTEDELDEYDYYKKKFRKKDFDISIIQQENTFEDEDEMMELCKRCGLSKLEEELFGG